MFRRVWDSLVKRRVEAESWEKEAREKDLSLAEVICSFFLFDIFLLLKEKDLSLAEVIFCLSPLVDPLSNLNVHSG